MRHELIGQDRFASFDPSISRTYRYEHVPSFETVLIRLLMRDPEAAEFARAHVDGKRLQLILKSTDHLKTIEEYKREVAA